MSKNLNIAPGARIDVRSEEWLVRSAEPSADGGQLILCEGVSGLVRGVEARFLTKLDPDIRVLNPADTQLVADPSSRFIASLLYIEALRLRSTPNDSRIRLAQHAVMKSHDYQFEPARIALKQARTRILIADTVGLGKTLEAGILATELIQRGRGKRILVITLKSMLTQFQKEWWSRFSIPLVRLDSVGLARVRDRIPSNHNPFNYYEKTIISMDTLKNNLEYRNYLEKAYWDIIVIDECHNVAMRANEQGSSRRARLAKLLSGRSDALILLSATPHDGSAKSFASLIHLLDRTVIPDPENYAPGDFQDRGLVIRRFKKDIRNEVQADFQERITERLAAPSSAEEERAYGSLLSIPFTQESSRIRLTSNGGVELQRVAMQKALFSSPAAAIDSVLKRIAKLDSQTRAELPVGARESILAERTAQETFLTDLRGVGSAQFSKYQLLLRSLRGGDHAWTGRDPDDRIVLFSERIETLNWLREHLGEDLHLKEKQIALLHGGLPDTEQQALVERFGRREDPVRLLLCSDVASEGLNLHYFCHRIVHFDMPWSLMTYLQRNGRVDRFGQTHQPVILYLHTEARNPKIRGDQRILEVLQIKDDQAHQNLGDPLAFLSEYDAERETEKVEDFMARGLSAEEVSRDMDIAAQEANDTDHDPIAALMAMLGADPPSDAEAPVEEHSLFPDHYAFARAGLALLEERGRQMQWDADDTRQMISLTPPSDLEARLRQIPREAQRSRYVLSPSVERVLEAMEESRQERAEEDTWPRVEYLWPQHPISSWLSDAVISEFRGHRAPVLYSSKLDPSEIAFLIAGAIPNRKGQPVVVDWQVATRTENDPFILQPFDAFAIRAGLEANKMPNSGKPLSSALSEALSSALPEALSAMQTHMIAQRQTFQRDNAPQLKKTLDDLDNLLRRQQDQLTLELTVPGALNQTKSARAETRRQEMERNFEMYREWIHETMETEPQPFLQVIAAVCHP